MYSYCSNNLLNIKDVFIKRVVHANFFVKVFIETKPFPQTCPRCDSKNHTPTLDLEPKQMPETRINTGFRHFNSLFKLFFWVDFSYKSDVISLQNRIILIWFFILLMWFQIYCTQIVPSTFPFLFEITHSS